MHYAKSLVWLGAAVALAGCSTMKAQIESSGAMGSEDQTYIMTAYELVQLDNQAGDLVASKAKDPRVTDVASQLVAQANALSPGLTAVLQAEGMQPPARIPEVASEIDKLKTLNGAAFDKAYVQDEIALHQRAIDVFKKEDTDTKNGEMRTQVETEMPAVQDDLAKLQALTTIPTLTAG